MTAQVHIIAPRIQPPEATASQDHRHSVRRAVVNVMPLAMIQDAPTRGSAVRPPASARPSARRREQVPGRPTRARARPCASPSTVPTRKRAGAISRCMPEGPIPARASAPIRIPPPAMPPASSQEATTRAQQLQPTDLSRSTVIYVHPPSGRQEPSRRHAKSPQSATWAPARFAAVRGTTGRLVGGTPTAFDQLAPSTSGRRSNRR
jgi:hypothetical protein